MNMFLFLLFFIFFNSFCLHVGFCDDTSQGTLLVSYHTDDTEERLHRIRFFLISDSSGKETMYPKGNVFVADKSQHSRLVAIEQLPAGSYTIKFLVPNVDAHFQDVPERKVSIAKGQVVRIDQAILPRSSLATTQSDRAHLALLSEIASSEQLAYLPTSLSKGNASSKPQMLLVPAGKAIIGDASNEEKINERSARVVMINAFAINAHEVTNEEYAAWLNQAQHTGAIAYVKEADNVGQVIDLYGNLLFKTAAADPYSQITLVRIDNDNAVFQPLPGKEKLPVIDVTWFGAMAYCQANHCRLPTEAEWEKAAGMAVVSEGQPLKKFRYGFSHDEVDPSWANYRNSDRSIGHFEVLTTPVGFYDGINEAPRITPPQKTHLAKSPCGAFDMSGNVWEWVSDWFDPTYYANMKTVDPAGPTNGTAKVVKGGCYDSLADGVRVSERLGLPPDYADAYTGFRIATDK